MILDAGKEVAELKAKLLAAEHEQKQREIAQAVTWERLQERAAEEEAKIVQRKAEAELAEVSAQVATNMALQEQNRIAQA